MSANHIYLMSLAASGKSTFAARYPEYAGYRVVDFASKLPRNNPLVLALFYIVRPFPALQRRARLSPRLNKVGPHYYFDAVTEFMDSAEQPMIVMGRRLRPQYLESETFRRARLGIVMIPEERHRRQCEQRRRELRNFLPWFDHWTTNFDKVRELRQSLLDYARQHDIEVFESFEDAVEALRDNSDNGADPEGATPQTA